MSPSIPLLNRVSVCAVLAFVFAQPAFAAVLILDGSESPAAAPPPLTSTPGRATPQSAPSAPSLSTSAPLTPSPESAILSPVSPAPTSPAVAAPVPVIVEPPASAANEPSAPTELSTAGVENSAGVSVEMMPGQTVSVGSAVSFRVTSRKAGYLVLIDVDAAGHLTQIYPNTALLTRNNHPNGNYIKPGGTLTIPLASDPYAGVRYVVSPPNGQAMIVAILSAQPVQILDMPDVPPDNRDKSAILVFLSNWTKELRIPDDGSQLRETKWSFNAKPYIIQ